MARSTPAQKPRGAAKSTDIEGFSVAVIGSVVKLAPEAPGSVAGASGQSYHGATPFAFRAG
jgi:hypothetical protein